jgi:exonuclease III
MLTNQKRLMMIGAFWNIRGLNKTGRLECLKDFISNNSLDFIGIQETKKESFHQSFFGCLGGHFDRNFLPASGTARGVLVGFRTSKFNILSSNIRQFCVSALISNFSNNFSWRLITVYGSAYDEHKQEFLEELHSIMGDWDGPTLLGGDFNLIIMLLRRTMVTLLTTGMIALMNGLITGD